MELNSGRWGHCRRLNRVGALGHQLISFVLVQSLFIGGLLSYVHSSLHPEIDDLFDQAGSPMPAEIAPSIGALRQCRKRMASIFLFVVLVVSMLRVQGRRPSSWEKVRGSHRFNR